MEDEVSETLASRMKDYEAVSESKLDPSKPFMMRLDGHCFSKFTCGFTKPFDSFCNTLPSPRSLTLS